MEAGGGESSETEPKKKGGKCMTGVGASLTPDFRNKEESDIISVINNICKCRTTMT